MLIIGIGHTDAGATPVLGHDAIADEMTALLPFRWAPCWAALPVPGLIRRSRVCSWTVARCSPVSTTEPRTTAAQEMPYTSLAMSRAAGADMMLAANRWPG